MTTTTQTKVDASIAPKLAEWFRAGRGVRVWRNVDLSGGNVGHQMFTPADVHTAPHWQYADDGAILPQDVIVQTFTPRTTFNGTAKIRYWGMTNRAAGETWTFTVERDYGRTYTKVEIGTMVETPLSL